jgi:hypothetical protein
MPILYPTGLTRRLQIILGLAVVGINIIIYAYVFFLRKRNPVGRGPKNDLSITKARRNKNTKKKQSLC